MATAATMQATHVRPGPVAIAPSPSSRSRLSSSRSQLLTSKPQSNGSMGKSSTQVSQQAPCDGCKRRNSRCAMNERVGKCYSCEFHRQDCIYTPVQSRKRSFDAALEGLDTKTPGPSKGRRSPVKSKKASNQSTNGTKGKPATTTPTVPVEQLQREENKICCFIGGTTDLELSLLEDLPSQDLPKLSDSNVQVERYGQETFMEVTADQQVESRIAQINELEKLVHPHQSLFSEHYISVVQASFPILSENDISNIRSDHFLLDPALVAAIYLFASVSRGSKNARLEELASTLLQESFLRPRLCTIQAGLIISQVWFLNSYLLNMQINAAAFDLGLHQDCSSWNISTSHKAERKRLAWALYAHDKWAALATGRPSLITPANWTVLPLVPTDFEQSDSSTPTVELFISYINLSSLLSSVLDIFYTLSSANMTSPQQILSLAKPVQLQLKEWYSNLPPSLKMDNTSNTSSSITNPIPTEIPTTSSSQSLGFLHLSYFATEILLHRRIIRSLSPSQSSNPNPAPYTPLHHICRLAAKTRLISSLDFLNRLRPSHLQAFWPVCTRQQFSMIGSFGTLLLATSPTVEEEEFYRSRIQEFRWTLSVSASLSASGGGAELGGQDPLGFTTSLQKVDLGLELWEKSRELRPVDMMRSVREVAEEMRRMGMSQQMTQRSDTVVGHGVGIGSGGIDFANVESPGSTLSEDD